MTLMSFGTFPDRTTKGTIACIEMAANVQKYFPDRPTVIAGSFTPTTDESGEPEKSMKKTILKLKGLWMIFSGNVASTIEEALKAKDSVTVGLKSGYIKKIVVCTEACHSRRAKLVWEKEFAEFDCEIIVRSFDTVLMIEPDHPMRTMRNKWLWLTVNVGVYCLWLVPPIYSYFKRNCKKMRQPVAIKS